MKKIIAMAKKHSQYLKVVFVIAVLIIVSRGFMKIMKNFNGDQFKNVIANTSTINFIAVILIGGISILPMIGYDFILQKILGNKFTKYYLMETSWLINTMNNMIGFGGIFSLGLRSQFYGRNLDQKDVLAGTSKIFLFTMSGLSFYSLLNLVAICSGRVNSFLNQYWPWLLIGALYFPAVMIITTVRKTGVLGGLANKLKFSLFGTSVAEWTGVAITFIVAGKAMGVKLPVVEILALFMAAMVIGMISLIPGGIGSFDFIMITGLQNLGVSEEVALAWLLLYRVAYYFIPFLIGLIFFIRHLGVRINKRFDNVPNELALEVTHNILKFLLYFSGMMLILYATVPEMFNSLKWLKKISPWSEHFVGQSPKIILGFLMVILGRGIADRVKKTYWPALIALFLATIYVWFYGESILSTILMIVMIILTIITRSELYREQLVLSFESMLKDGVVIAGLIFLYIVVGFHNIPNKDFHWIVKISNSKDFLLFPSENLWFSGFLATILISMLMFIFIHFLEGRKIKIGEVFNERTRQNVVKILENYGGNTESQLVFLGDKYVFFYVNDQREATSFLQFAYFRDKAIVMGNPAGKMADYKKLLASFIEQCDLWDYSPVFYEITQEATSYLHEFGFNLIKMGEEGHVDLEKFTISGKKQRGLRATMNRLNKAGLTMKIVDPPFSLEMFDQLEAVSNQWLKGRRERGFSMGFFDRDYLNLAPIALVYDQHQEIVAFANIMSTFTENQISIDLMRYGTDAPSGVMDFLFISLFLYYQEQGFKTFNLGMAPLSNVGTSRKSFVQERIANIVYKFSSHFYSFNGLRDYKNKYADDWRARFTMYSREDLILVVMWSLFRIDNRGR